MKVDTSKVGLVRGYIIYSQWRAGCIGMEEARDDDNVRVGVAYTPWHRHDDDPLIVENELSKLVKLYMSFKESDGAMFGFEYRPYSN